MIIAVSGIAFVRDNQHQSEYKREFYQIERKLDLKEKVKEDFGEMLANEMSKLKINILIQGLTNNNKGAIITLSNEREVIVMRFYCVELKWNFDSAVMAYTLEALGLTVIQRDFCVAIAF